MIARITLAAVVLGLPVAHAAELAIGAVVVKSARVSVHGPRRIALITGSTESVQVTVLLAGEAGVRVVFTP